MSRRNRIGSKAIFAAALAAAASARAGAIVYDLRFAGVPSTDPTAHKRTAAIGTLDLELWIQLTGTDGNHSNEALLNSYVSVISSGNSGGSVGSLSNGVLVPPFDGTGSRAGSGSELNADGLGDWGSTNSNATNTNYMFVRTSTTGGEFAPGTGEEAANPAYGQASADTWEFEVATFKLNITAVGTSPFSFGVPKMAATKNGSTGVAVATWVTDGVSMSPSPSQADLQSPGSAFYAPGHFITLVVPEPAALALVAGSTCAGFLRRRRDGKGASKGAGRLKGFGSQFMRHRCRAMNSDEKAKRPGL